MNKLELRRFQEENILQDLLLSLNETRSDFSFQSGKLPIELGTFSFSNYDRKDLLIVNEYFKDTQLYINFDLWFLNEEVAEAQMKPHHDSIKDVTVGTISISTLKQGIHKVKERLSSITPKENETNINSITFFVNSKTKSPEEYSINNEKKYGMRKNDSMRKFFRLHDERSINFKSQTLAKDFLKPLANKKGSPTKNGYLNSHKLIKVEETNGEFKMKLKNPKIISIK